MEDYVKQVAVLIDGDNISDKYAEYIRQEARQYGKVKILRLYGSVNSPSVKRWYRVMPKYGISPVLQICYVHGKSVADQALTIDAMDILHMEKIDVFCIVSSDSDYTKLVYRIREAGKTVKQEISSTAPRDTGAYAKSWAIKSVKETSDSLEVVVHSKKRYRLTHLLEHGHAKRGGGNGSAGEDAQVTEIELTITEGRFHQVKRMFEAAGKKVCYLRRESMGSLTLDKDLKPGQYRRLTDEELKSL